MTGQRTIDLETDPPPDIVVEIDTASESLSKFAIYAALGVPEIWRYEGTRVHMYRLADGSYVSFEGSRFLAGLTSALLTEFVELSKTETQTRTVETFRDRIRTMSGM